MKHATLFSLLIPVGIITVVLTTFSNSLFSFTPEEEAVFEKAQKSLDANQNQSSVGSNFLQIANRTSGSGGLTLTNTYSFYDTLGYFQLTGEVINNATDAMQNIRAVATYVDSSKKVVGTSTGYVQPEIVNSGDKGAFVISGPDPTQSKKINSFKITLDGDFANPKPTSLKISIGNSYRDKYGITYNVAGEITNSGQDSISSVHVYGTFYDKKGRVLYTTSTYPPQTDLSPGQSTPFELSAYGTIVDKISSFKIFADSSDYSSIG